MSRAPQWLKKRLVLNHEFSRTRALLSEWAVPTVCESSLCPNINDCFSRKQAAFMILGEICTRSCAFCAVGKGAPSAVDCDEPRRVAMAALNLGLAYAVVTSVTRDDLADGGAAQFARVIEKTRDISSGSIDLEVLVPDFLGRSHALELVANAAPAVMAHNIETVKRLYPKVRPDADYERSIAVLRMIKEFRPRQLTKSGIMVGLGEAEEEVFDVIKDIRDADCDILTIGQYLRPAGNNIEVAEFISPEIFERYRAAGEALGFRYVSGGPFVRSSYMAHDIYKQITGGINDRCYAAAAC